MTTDRNASSVFSDRVDAPYWEGLSGGELRLLRCRGCGEWIWPAEWRCGECGSFDLGWEPVAPTGEVYSWNRTHYPFMAAFADLVPYVTVMVALPQAGGRRLLGRLVGDEGGLRIGAAVTGVIEPPSPRTQNLPALCWEVSQ